MSIPLYPLRFKPIFKPAIWGGRRLAKMFPGAPTEGPIGETWVLSEHGDDVSVVSDGALVGCSLRELMKDRSILLGEKLAYHQTFPLLLKFIDAAEPLSVQVHPSDELAQSLAYVPRGKSEAWVVMRAEPRSRIFAGLKPGVDRPLLLRALADGEVGDLLHSFEPRAGDCVYLPAGTVHALGAGITIFEVQQTSDTTYRLFDWNRIDPTTGRGRQLHVEQAIACTNFTQGRVQPVTPVRDDQSAETELLVDCPYFGLRRGLTTASSDPMLNREARVIVSWGSREIRSVYGALLPEVLLVPAGVPTPSGWQSRASLLEIRLK
jgi:mannose-6-phosphate isomerase